VTVYDCPAFRLFGSVRDARLTPDGADEKMTEWVSVSPLAQVTVLLTPITTVTVWAEAQPTVALARAAWNSDPCRLRGRR